MPKDRKKPCPICGKDPVPTFAPFCSQRCVTIDLGRWLGESYVAQTDEEPDQDDQ